MLLLEYYFIYIMKYNGIQFESIAKYIWLKNVTAQHIIFNLHHV